MAHMDLWHNLKQIEQLIANWFIKYKLDKFSSLASFKQWSIFIHIKRSKHNKAAVKELKLRRLLNFIMA